LNITTVDTRNSEIAAIAANVFVAYFY
jgi:hypothetical protein